MSDSRSLGAALFAVAVAVSGVVAGALIVDGAVQAQPAAAAAKAAGAAVQLERRVVATVPDAATNFTLGRDNGRSLQVDLARAAPGLAGQRFTLVSVSRNGSPGVAPAALSVAANGELRWDDITPGSYGNWRLLFKAEDTTGRAREVVLPVEVRLPPDTPDICEAATRPWCAFARERWARGEAAGNLEDFYNNRDGGHAAFPIGKFSRQIRPLAGGQATLLSPWPTRNVVGNASVFYQGPFAANMERFHSFSPSQFDAKVRIYESNHVFWYPAHTDIFGNGDLFHFNAAYTNTSVGSSGSEMDEIERTFVVWAMLRPDVKQRVVERGLLAPLTQMLLRRNRVDSDAAYLSGLAHLTGFYDIPAEVAEQRLLELAKAANAITVRDIPPFAKLRVASEDFSAADREQLATNAWGVHRIWRREDHPREMVLSAADSFDLNGRALEYRWVVLRGLKYAKLEPVEGDPRSMRVVFTYPHRFPVEFVPPGGQAHQTNRIDIGLFVHNGVAWSPPAMVTVFALDSEVRMYDLTNRLLWRKPSGRADHARLK
ncbi:MAG: hypothetical protein ACK515_00705 [bacterium]|nr:hypothetical protein [Betaproteobacteria bacterium]